MHESERSERDARPPVIMAQWYCRVAGIRKGALKQYGPISSEALHGWILERRLSPTDLVSRDGERWVPASEIKGITWPPSSALPALEVPREPEPPAFSAASHPVPVRSTMPKQSHTLGLGRVIGMSVVWLFVFFILPPMAAGLGSSGNFKVTGNTWYLGPNSLPLVKAVFTISWLLAIVLYCLFWSLVRTKEWSRGRDAALRAGTDPPFSLGQQAIQSGIVAGCRGVVITFAVMDYFVWLDIFSSPAYGYYLDQGYINIGASLSPADVFGASLFVGLVVAIIAALVRYATIAPRTGRP